MKRILITGGNGFLGSGLVRYFLDSNFKVAVISRNKNNIVDIEDKITYIQTDSDTYYAIKNEILSFAPDYVIHLAWSGGNSNLHVNDISQFNKNIPLSMSLLDIIGSLKNKPMFIGVGSFEEYGILNKRAKETDVEVPANFYGLSKLTFKNTSNSFCNEHFIQWAWIRPCYIYGANDVSTRLIPRTIKSALMGQDINLNSCNVTLDYLHISDFCKAVGKIVELNLSGVYNICSGQEYQLRDILTFLYTEISSGANIRFDNTLDTKKYVCGDNNRIKKLSGWDAGLDLHTGLLNTISYYKNIL